MAVGSSGTGKTDAVITLLMWLMMDALIVYAKHDEGDQWQEVKRRCRRKKKDGTDTLPSWFQSDLKKVIPVKQIAFEGRIGVVFDDQQEVNDSEGTISDYVSNGRHQGLRNGYGGISTFNLDQSRVGLEKRSRGNTTVFMLFAGVNDEDLKEYWERSGKDLPFEVFCALYYACVAIPHGFFFIYLGAKHISGKYRFQFDCLLKGLPDVEIKGEKKASVRKEATEAPESKISAPIALREIESPKPEPKRRGRKPGSKNKPKVKTENEPRTA